MSTSSSPDFPYWRKGTSDDIDSRSTFTSSGSISLQHLSSSAEAPGNYSDRFVEVDGASGTLTIKHWHLLHSTVQVPVSKIIYILPASRATSKIGVKEYGYGLTGIWWAMDFGRVLPMGKAWDNSFVVKWKGGKVRGGFTFERPAEFWGALETLEPGVTGRDKNDQEEIGRQRGRLRPLEGGESQERLLDVTQGKKRSD